MIKDNVEAVTSDGSSCFVCETRIRPGESAVSVRFGVPLGIATVTLDREMHVRCAEKLAELLRLRIKEARRM